MSRDDRLGGLALEVVTFGAGGHRFGLEAARVRAQTGTCPGAARAVEEILNLPEAAAGAPRVFLELRDGAAGVGLAVRPPVELRRFAVSAVHPLPFLIAVRTRLAAVRALIVDRAEVIVLVEIPGSLLEARLAPVN